MWKNCFREMPCLSHEDRGFNPQGIPPRNIRAYWWQVCMSPQDDDHDGNDRMMKTKTGWQWFIDYYKNDNDKMMMMAIIKEQWRRVPPATCGPPKLHRKNNCRIQIILVNIKFCMKTLAKVQNKSASLCQNAYLLYSNFRFFGFLYHHWNSSGSDQLWKVCFSILL